MSGGGIYFDAGGHWRREFFPSGKLDFTMDTRTMLISPKAFGYGPENMMLSIKASCPNCRHVFPLPACGGAAADGGTGCRERNTLSGGWLLTAKPPPPCPLAAPSPPDTDLLRLKSAVDRLARSGWYYEDLTLQASQEALKDCSPGTFLVRDSGDPNFLYSLSVQTAKGPTSVRLHYAGGFFRLDAEAGLVQHMPRFDCVVKLVQHYVEATRARKGGPGHVWVDATGGQHSPVEVIRPLNRAPPKLAHAARLAVNRALRSAAAPVLPLLPPYRQLGLPPPLQTYLAEYPYTC